jgi:hypothetical protein
MMTSPFTFDPDTTMRSLLTTVAFGCLVLVAHPARAQQTPLPSTPIVLPPSSFGSAELSSSQDEELAQWVEEMGKWLRQEKRWSNEPVHNNYGKIVPRKPQPQAPEWLTVYCDSVSRTPTAAPPRRIDQACRMLAGLEVDPEAEAIRQQTQAVRADKEKVVKTSFMSRLHLDGLWTTTSSDVRYYGLVGSHISLVDVGRVQFFGPPGVLLLRMPDTNGTHQIRVGYTWGMSVRLTDLKLLSPYKNATLFLSITKCWTVGSDTDRLRPGGFDIAGFSIAPRKNH